MSTSAGFGALTTFDVNCLCELHLVPIKAELRARHFIEVAGVRLLLLRQHAALTAADARADNLGALCRYVFDSMTLAHRRKNQETENKQTEKENGRER